MELNKMSTEELVELIRPKRCADHYNNLTKKEKNEILHEIFNVRGVELENGLLHDVLWSCLPVSPNGDKKLTELQHQLAKANTCELNRSMPMQQVLCEKMLIVFSALTLSNIVGSEEIAKEVYQDLQLRGRETEIPEGIMYSYIRRIIPSSDNANFREVAHNMLRIIIDNS